MTKNELLKRIIFIEATPRMAKVNPIRVRSRGQNIISQESGHPSEDFDDFFDYEKEMLELTPARNTVSTDLESLSKNSNESQLVEIEEINTGFIIMEIKEPEVLDKNNNIESDSVKISGSFEFLQCQFEKENGDRCKKQAKKDQKYCLTHRKFLAKNN